MDFDSNRIRYISAPGVHSEHYFMYEPKKKCVTHKYLKENKKELVGDSIDFLIGWLFYELDDNIGTIKELREEINELKQIIEDNKDIKKYKTLKEESDLLVENLYKNIERWEGWK